MKIEELPEYTALDARRQKIARDVANGATLTTACRAVGLNPTREKKNLDLQRCLWKFKTGVDPTAQDTAPPSIYEEAAALEREMETWPADKRAAYDAEMEAKYPRDKNWPCHNCGKSCDRAIGLCAACAPDCRCNAADCPRNPKCRENSKPAPPPRPGPALAVTVTKKCRACGLPAGPRDIVCSDASCVGALGIF